MRPGPRRSVAIYCGDGDDVVDDDAREGDVADGAVFAEDGVFERADHAVVVEVEGGAGVPAFEDVVEEGFIGVGEDGPCAEVWEFFWGVAEGGEEGLVGGEDGAEFLCGADEDGDGDFVDDASEAGFALFEFDFCEFAVGDIEADACEFEGFAVGSSGCDGDGADVADFAIGSDDAVFLFAAVAGGHGAEDAFEVVWVDGGEDGVGVSEDGVSVGVDHGGETAAEESEGGGA